MAPKTDSAETEVEPVGTPDNSLINRPLTVRQRYFVSLVLDGKSHSDAYRVAYCKPDHGSKQIAQQAYEIAVRPNVRLALKAAKYDAPATTLLSKDDILRVCAGMVMSETASRYERLRAAETYAKLAGFFPREWENLPGVTSDGTDGPVQIVVNIFQNAPSRVRAAIPVVPLDNLTSNGNGHH